MITATLAQTLSLKWNHWVLLISWSYKGSEGAGTLFVLAISQKWKKMSYLSRKNRASQINRSTPGLRELTVLPLLVSTISLGRMSSLGWITGSEKVLVEHTTPEEYRGVAGTVKVTYG